MEFYRLALILHLIGAAIWVGGHLILTLTIFPPALRAQNPAPVREFERRYEFVGIPSLVLQVITGVFLASRWSPGLAGVLAPGSTADWFILVKLVLLLLTVIIAAHARYRVIPFLDETNLRSLAYHAYSVTLLGIAFLITGVAIRTGGLY